MAEENGIFCDYEFIFNQTFTTFWVKKDDEDVLRKATTMIENDTIIVKGIPVQTKDSSILFIKVPKTKFQTVCNFFTHNREVPFCFINIHPFLTYTFSCCSPPFSHLSLFMSPLSFSSCSLVC